LGVADSPSSLFCRHLQRWASKLILSTLFLATCALALAGEEALESPGFNDDAAGDGLPDHCSTTPDCVLWRERVFMGKEHEIVSKSPAYVLATQDVEPGVSSNTQWSPILWEKRATSCTIMVTAVSRFAAEEGKS